uniref:Carboxypeptidase Q n=1 Tax=Panagrolaimus sp. PS1159 TaxID=55785 RepID=A0AC35FJY8_9BILA
MKSIDFVTERLKKDGFDNVHTEDVPNLPHWIRGDDKVTMIEPRNLELNILAVSGTDPTNITGEVIVAHTFEELSNLNATGKIVLLIPEWKGYFKTVQFRRGGDTIEKAGGIGLMVKSIGPFSIGSPHTGSGASKAVIPTVCLTIEEAELMERLIKRGKKVVVNMNLKSKNVGKITSRNIIFDITGSEKPDEVVLLSGHIDSWDVGQGAMDDGGGMAAVWQAMLTIKRLAAENPAFKPKRTIRGVYWTAEEQGLFGAKHYFEEHKNGSETFFFVSETDQGAFRPRTLKSKFNFMGNKHEQKRIQQIATLLTENDIPISVNPSNLQGDVQFWADDGVPSINYVSEQGEDYYFYFHHTSGDYMTIFKNDDLQYTSAVFAALGHVLANVEAW